MNISLREQADLRAQYTKVKHISQCKYFHEKGKKCEECSHSKVCKK